MTIENIASISARRAARSAEARRVDLLVPPAMLIVACAAGTAAYLHLGTGGDLAAMIAASLFCLFLTCHVLLRAKFIGSAASRTARSPAGGLAAGSTATKAPSNDRAKDRAKDRADVSLAKAASRSTQAEAQVARGDEPTADESSAVRRPHAQAKTRASLDTTEPPSVLPPSLHPLPQAPVAGSVSNPAPAMPADLHSPANELALPATELSELQPASEWSFRPTRQDFQDAFPSSTKPGPAADNFGTIRPAGLSAPIPDSPQAGIEAPADSEEQRVDSILKRLAQQIRGDEGIAEGAEPADHSASAPAGAPDDPAATREAATVAPESDTSLATAVNALRSTVEAMRTSPANSSLANSSLANSGASSTPKDAWADLLPIPMPVDAHAAPDDPDRDIPEASAAEVRLAAVAEALANERAEVCLEPILALDQETARHFEVSVRLKTSTGELIDARQIIETARHANASGSSSSSGARLLPVLDAIGLRHSAGFALKLERRGREGQVFSEVAGESLQSMQFMTDVASRRAHGIADRLVLTFVQDEIQGLGPAQLAALSELSRLGFRFAMQGVSHLDMDFEALKSIGFEFIKLDADIFLQGLALDGSTIPPGDLCRHFASQGLAIIVGGIADETIRAHILGFGVVFGQGTLFGAPRPIPVAADPGLHPARAVA